jgi:hypothetical protein
MMSAILILSTPSKFAVRAFTTSGVSRRATTNLAMSGNVFEKGDKGKILVLGGSGKYKV